MLLKIIGLLIFVIFYFVCAVVIHELGHWLFGKIVGYEFKRMNIGPFSFIKEDKKIKVKVTKKIMSMGAMVVQIKDFSALSQKGFLVMIAGGVAFSAIVGCIALMLSIVFRNFHFLALAIMCLDVGVLLAFFPGDGVVRTDRQIISLILKQGRDGENEYTIWYLYQCTFVNELDQHRVEVRRRVLDILHHKSETNVFYVAMVLMFILDEKFYIINKEDAVQQLKETLDVATPRQQKWIREFLAQPAYVPIEETI